MDERVSSSLAAQLLVESSKEGYARGYAAALDAAREAVAALSKPDFHWANATDGQCGMHVGYEHALAAIDALRETN